MFTSQEKAEMLLREADSRYYLIIPFDLKDSLKTSVANVRFNMFGLNEWSVSLRLKQKLIDWVIEHFYEITKYHLIKTRKELSAGELVCIANAYDIKEIIKFKFAGIFAEYGNEKGWFVRPEHVQQVCLLRDEALLNQKMDKVKPLSTDSKPALLVKMEKVIEEFDITKQASGSSFGFISTYQSDNQDIKSLIKQAADIVANNSKRKFEDSTLHTFSDEFKAIIRDISLKHNAFIAIETVFYHILVKVFDAANNGDPLSPWLNSEYCSEKDIAVLIANYFHLTQQ